MSTLSQNGYGAYSVFDFATFAVFPAAPLPRAQPGPPAPQTTQLYRDNLCTDIFSPTRNPLAVPPQIHPKHPTKCCSVKKFYSFFSNFFQRFSTKNREKNCKKKRQKKAKKKWPPDSHTGARRPKVNKTGRTNRETRDKPQWIVTQRLLSHVQRPDHN